MEAAIQYHSQASKALCPRVIHIILTFFTHPKELCVYRLINTHWNEQVQKYIRKIYKDTEVKILGARKPSENKLDEEEKELKDKNDADINEEQKVLICLLLSKITPFEKVLFSLAITKPYNMNNEPERFLESFLELRKQVIKNKSWSHTGIDRTKFLTEAEDYGSYTPERKKSLLKMDFYLNIPIKSLDMIENVFQAIPFPPERKGRNVPNFRLASWARETLRFGKLAHRLTREAQVILKGIAPKVSSDKVLDALLKDFNCLFKIVAIWDSGEMKKPYERRMNNLLNQLNLETERIKEKDEEIRNLTILRNNLIQEIKDITQSIREAGDDVNADLLLDKLEFHPGLSVD